MRKETHKKVLDKYAEYLSDGNHSREAWEKKNDELIGMLTHEDKKTGIFTRFIKFIVKALLFTIIAIVAILILSYILGR